MALLAGFQALLYRYTGQEDLLIGTPIANRNRSEIEGLIGFFVNTLALRGRLVDEDGAVLGFGGLLARARAAPWGATPARTCRSSTSWRRWRRSAISVTRRCSR